MGQQLHPFVGLAVGGYQGLDVLPPRFHEGVDINAGYLELRQQLIDVHEWHVGIGHGFAPSFG